jgi:SAM-dependent methyltransferase
MSLAVGDYGMSSSQQADYIEIRCRACDRTGQGLTHRISESMYGSGEAFEYTECSCCGSLQIINIPQNLASYYPSNYYSQAQRTEPPEPRGLKRQLYEFACVTRSLAHPNLLRRALTAALPLPNDYLDVGRYLAATRFKSRNEYILDVGCGSSPHRLAAMRRCGFRHVQGIDPFIDSNVTYHGVAVRKCSISEESGTFALVMFHHSLEHVTNPFEDLVQAARLLKRGGLCVVRLPIMGSYMWRHFGSAWIELDAPRHLLVPSKQGLGELATRAGFSVERIEFDSEPWELEASRQYQAGIPLKRQLHYQHTDTAASSRRVRDLSLTMQLNALTDGGRACIYLRRP